MHVTSTAAPNSCLAPFPPHAKTCRRSTGWCFLQENHQPMTLAGKELVQRTCSNATAPYGPASTMYTQSTDITIMSSSPLKLMSAAMCVCVCVCPDGFPQVTQKSTGPLTPAQLTRLQELLVAQHNAIAADSAELEALSSLLEAWKLDHPEVELPARLARLGTVV